MTREDIAKLIFKMMSKILGVVGLIGIVIGIFMGVFMVLFCGYYYYDTQIHPDIGDLIIEDNFTFSIEDMTLSDKVCFACPVPKESKYGRDWEWQEVKSGTGWKFVVFDIHVGTRNQNPIYFEAGKRLEDEDGLKYPLYSPHCVLTDRNDPNIISHGSQCDITLIIDTFSSRIDDQGDDIKVMYRIPVDSVPKKLYYDVYDTRRHHLASGSVYLS